MTYCAAINLKDGIVFASDTRTNAGVDHISTFKKTHSFGVAGERVITILSAGNLATSQAVIKMLKKDIEDASERSIYTLPSLFDIAATVGEYANQVKHKSQETAMSQQGFGSTFLVGGQLKGRSSKLYLVYDEGNFIHATQDTPFLQIGESKYGKPILDRAIEFDSSIDDALRALLVSFDSTARSNLSVGFPIDISVYHTNSFTIPQGRRIEENDPYFQNIRDKWSNGLIEILQGFDAPPDDYSL